MGDGRVALPTLAAQLLQDGVAVARAEIRLAKAKLTTKIAAVRTGAIFLALAAVLLLLGLIGLTVGCVIALATLIGPGLAGLAVFAALAIVAGIFALIGIRQLSTKPEAVVEKVT